MSTPVEPAGQLAAVLGRIPSGLCILTAHDGQGRETGMLASWVQQASFDPPCVTVAINRKRYINDWLRETSKIGLSIVAEGQKQLLGHFGKGFEPDEAAFEGLETAHAANGCPVLTACLGWLAGRVMGTLEVGDHVVYAVELTEAGGNGNLDRFPPWVHIRKSGLTY